MPEKVKQQPHRDSLRAEHLWSSLQRKGSTARISSEDRKSALSDEYLGRRASYASDKSGGSRKVPDVPKIEVHFEHDDEKKDDEKKEVMSPDSADVSAYSYHRATSASIKGLPLTYFHKLIEVWGGPEALAGKSTTDVVVAFILPMTSDTQLSLCEHYLHDEAMKDIVQDAEWFISHAWKNPFLDTISALDNFFGERGMDPSTTYIWLDFASSSQYFNEPRSYEWLANIIKPIKNTVMVLQPWIDPLPLKRCWCILEVYVSKLTEARFHVALTASQTEEFMQAMHEDPEAFFNVLANTSCEKSQASLDHDRAAIFAIVREKIGFTKLDTMVMQVFVDWIREHLQGKIAAAEEDVLEQADWLALLGRFDHLTGHFDRAEPHLMQSYELRKAGHGDEHPKTLVSLHYLSVTYTAQGRYEEAEPRLLKCIDSGKKVLGDEHPNVLKSVDKVAILYRRVGKLHLSEKYQRNCLASRKRVLGIDHADTLASMNNLALVYKNLFRFKDAEILYREAMSHLFKLLGEDHSQSLTLKLNLGSVYLDQRRYESAEPFLTSAYDHQIREHGEAHYETLTTMNYLGVLHTRTARHETAEKLLQKCIDLREEVLGDKHADTLVARLNLAQLYRIMSRYDEAERMLHEWMQDRPHAFGDDNIYVLIVRHNLGLVYVAKKEFKKAEEIIVETLAKKRVALGESHPQTIEAMLAVANLYWKQGRYTDARTLFHECATKSSSVLGEDHPDTLHAIVDMAEFERDEGSHKDLE
ncbi:hypothetical protein BC830DRAFT_586416 [Chytriomyces sp. MP71]|nr:hypothetical protein BC830DRAFT_586416 [Chytriomyces sp. MP71]